MKLINRAELNIVIMPNDQQNAITVTIYKLNFETGGVELIAHSTNSSDAARAVEDTAREMARALGWPNV